MTKEELEKVPYLFQSTHMNNFLRAFAHNSFYEHVLPNVCSEEGIRNLPEKVANDVVDMYSQALMEVFFDFVEFDKLITFGSDILEDEAFCRKIKLR